MKRSGPFSSECGAVTIRAASGTVRAKVSGTLEDLDRAGALLLESCGSGSLSLREGKNLLEAEPGAVFTADHLRIIGPPTDPPAPAPGPASPTERNWSGGWLVLGQSFSPAWRASCRSSDGERRDLGEPVLIDGFANGWRTGPAGCPDPDFVFAPQRWANAAYAISILSVVGIGLMLLAAWRRRRPPEREAEPPEEAERLRAEISASPAGEVAFDATVGDRDTPGDRPGRMQRVGTWLLAGSALLVGSLGAIYVSNPDPSGQGINFDYAINQVAAHWVALGATGLLLVGGLIRLGWQMRSGSNASRPGPG